MRVLYRAARSSYFRFFFAFGSKIVYIHYMPDRIQGRGSSFNPQNRFEKLRIDYSPEEIQEFGNESEGIRKIETVYLKDSSRSILAKNDSPDVPFTFSINPYRGCEHGCIYCYARPSHEWLGFSAGLDFESKILVKMDAPQLLEEALRDPKFEPQVIALSGNTDCYQPVERKLQLTRGCLEVFLKYKNPVGVITKNASVLRDLDLLQDLAMQHLAAVTISITSLDPALISRMEPRTSTPANRLATVRKLADAGIHVGVNVAPVIPGLTDQEIPEIVKQAAENGATSADIILLRLPFAVKELFCEWIEREFPMRAGKVLNRIRETRGGKLSDPRFHSRMSGEGELADMISSLFNAACKRYHLNEKKWRLTTRLFRRPGQIPLFS
jgi:DNA repair photolyase